MNGPTLPPAQGQGGTPVVVVQRTGNCPRCGVGMIVPEFTICGIILAVLCFPIGVLCCFLMREPKCSNCGATG